MMRPPLSRPTLVGLGLLAVALVLIPLSDLEVIATDPWSEVLRFGAGLLAPSFPAGAELTTTLAYTIGIAILGVVVAGCIGFVLSAAFFARSIRVICAVLRSVHELFWALIFLQFFGPSPLTGLLAIAVPYAAIFAKVFAEIAEETASPSAQVIPRSVDWVSRYLYVRLPDLWPHFKIYALYRLECGLRSSAILGFVGLPTLGYHLESAFLEGSYPEVSGLLILFYLLIASVHHWARPATIPLLCLAGLFLLPWNAYPFDMGNVLRFFAEDIVPSPLRDSGLSLSAALLRLWEWLGDLWSLQILPGAVSTIQVTMLALALTGILSLVLFPAISPLLINRSGRFLGNAGLIILRSTPEYLLAFMLLQFWGPSMLPAVVALALHNGSIIGHLVGRHTGQFAMRPDTPRRRLDRYFYEVLPRAYPQLLAYLFYRWEVIMRETAVFGMLGVATLGFYIDNAFSELRLDRAMLLIAVTAALNIGIDYLSRKVRAYARVGVTADTAA